MIESMLSFDGVYFTVGCHPHFAQDMFRFKNFEFMKHLVSSRNGKLVGIGECGLDTSRKNKTSMNKQIEVFKFQIRLAVQFKKALVLHIRGAEKEALGVLEELPHDWPIHRYDLIRIR